VFIEIEDLKPEPLCVRHVYGAADLRFEHDDAVLGAPVATDFTLTHQGKELHISGTVATEIRHQCSRCLRERTYPFFAGFDLMYLPQPERRATDEEIELRDDDMAVGFYDGVRLDVDLMILEQIELSVPMKFLCKEDCRGLCPNCGANLNDGPCRCLPEAHDARLAVLLEFRKKMDK
jgi:uncharacterized protein